MPSPHKRQWNNMACQNFQIYGANLSFFRKTIPQPRSTKCVYRRAIWYSDLKTKGKYKNPSLRINAHNQSIKAICIITEFVQHIKGSACLEPQSVKLFPLLVFDFWIGRENCSFQKHHLSTEINGTTGPIWIYLKAYSYYTHISQTWDFQPIRVLIMLSYQLPQKSFVIQI